MFNKQRIIASPANEQPLDNAIHFTAASSFENVNFFPCITDEDPNYDFSNMTVWINKQKSSQSANSITANANDDIIIGSNNEMYPCFGASSNNHDIDYIKAIVEPFPAMHNVDGSLVTNVSRCFIKCYHLETICDDLFINNLTITNFNYCFLQCYSLLSIPANLFTNHVDARSFSYCFQHCHSLTETPIDLFMNNVNATSFYQTFYYCNELVVNVRIGSTASNVSVNSFAAYTKDRGTVYCKQDSPAYTAFSESTNANVDVLIF